MEGAVPPTLFPTPRAIVASGYTASASVRQTLIEIESAQIILIGLSQSECQLGTMMDDERLEDLTRVIADIQAG